MGRCTNFNCNNEALEELLICDDCCFIRSLEMVRENMGIPDYYMCVECERKFYKPEYFADHLPCEGD